MCFFLLQLLHADKRREYLYQLQEFMVTDNSRNWRFRYELAECVFFSSPNWEIIKLDFYFSREFTVGLTVHFLILICNTIFKIAVHIMLIVCIYYIALLLIGKCACLPDWRVLSFSLSLSPSRQLILIIELYSHYDVYDYLRQIALTLCSDKVSEVRWISYKLVSEQYWICFLWQTLWQLVT